MGYIFLFKLDRMYDDLSQTCVNVTIVVLIDVVIFGQTLLFLENAWLIIILQTSDVLRFVR